MAEADVVRMRELARTLPIERFVARFPWDFLVVLAGADENTIQYVTRTGGPIRAGHGGAGGILDVVALLKTTASTASATTILIGRSRACDVALNDASVSKIHARVALTLGRASTIEDAGSHNGTRVRGERIALRAPVPIRAGDAVAFGSVNAVLLDAAGLHELLLRS